VLDVAVAEVSLQRSRIVTFVGQRKTTGVAEHVRVSLEAELGLDASAFHHARKASLRLSPKASWRSKPPVEKGEFLSDVNTNGDFGSCSRCNLRRARISSPRMGWVVGTPFLARRTCRTAWAKST
jgi:hypothetical protein